MQINSDASYIKGMSNNKGLSKINTLSSKDLASISNTSKNEINLTVEYSGTNIMTDDDSMQLLAERVRDDIARLDLRDGGLR